MGAAHEEHLVAPRGMLRQDVTLANRRLDMDRRKQKIALYSDLAAQVSEASIPRDVKQRVSKERTDAAALIQSVVRGQLYRLNACLICHYCAGPIPAGQHAAHLTACRGKQEKMLREHSFDPQRCLSSAPAVAVPPPDSDAEKYNLAAMRCYAQSLLARIHSNMLGRNKEND